MSKKISKNFRFSPETIMRLELISKKESRSLTNALEYMINEKADFYGIKVLKKKEPPSGAFPYNGGLNKDNFVIEKPDK